LLSSPRPEEAIGAFAHAVEIDAAAAVPVFIQAAYHMLQLGRPDAAVAAFAQVTELQPGSVPARQGHAIALMTMRRFDLAAPELAAMLKADPGADYLAGVALHAKLQCCDWNRFDEDTATITRRVRQKARADAPLSFIVHNDSPADQLICARIYAADKCAADAAASIPALRRDADRLRIAYLSGDLRDHAVGQCLIEVLEAHDRTRFETYAFSTGPNDLSPLRHRIERSVEHFLEVAADSDQTIAARMASLPIDIAVDLGGHSTGGRTRVLAFRPAPLQVSFLGFPGTTGTDYVDYLVADERVVPEVKRAHYSEQLVYLPGTCFPTPRHTTISPPARAEAGLPRDVFVYCAFNGPHKISPSMYALWMNVLRAVPHSVLWLRGAPQVVRQNLARETARLGVSPERLIFAERTGTRMQHLARFALADVFLDTYPYGAHTTAAEALLVHIPVVTLKGLAFASRVAFSLLHACGLDSLALDSMEQYQALAIDLGLHPEKAAELKRKLMQAPPARAMFAPEQFCRDLESAFLRMHERRVTGERPSVMRI
jgi:predicted O-linked N-acetylglucosamine transferase (SPINDLY family)